MALNIKDEATDRLARELAGVTGESITSAVNVALRERLERLQGGVPSEQRLAAMRRITAKSARLPILDDRTDEEILGYDENGLPS